MRIQILTGLLFIMPAMVVPDTVYQWTGEDGNIHYSDKPPPPGTQVFEKDLKPMPDIGTVKPSQNNNITPSENPQLVAEKVEQENAQLNQRRKDATTYEEALEIECGLVRGVIDKLSSRRDISMVNTEGTTRAISEAERQERLRVSQKYINEHCI